VRPARQTRSQVIDSTNESRIGYSKRLDFNTLASGWISKNPLSAFCI
jgi:hypothetical protein